MSDLATMIRTAASSGNLTHISVVPSQDGKKFRATFAPAKKFGVRFAEHTDPVEAILLALKSDVKAPRTPIKVDGKLKETVETIPQPIVEVTDTAEPWA